MHWYDRERKPHHNALMTDARKDKLLPSVTTILAIISKGEWLDIWRQNQTINLCTLFPRKTHEKPEDYLERINMECALEKAFVLQVGTGVHALCETYLADDATALEKIGTNDEVSELATESYVSSDVEIFLDRYMESAEGEGFAEEVVVSPFGFAGTVDYFWVNEKEVFVRDFKTQNVKRNANFYYDWLPQLVAYAVAIQKLKSNNFVELFLASADLRSLVISTGAVQGSWEIVWTLKAKVKAWKIFQSAFELCKVKNDYDPAWVEK